ncbi:MAG: VanZ family protein [Thermodesulfobacteriota bacterium]
MQILYLAHRIPYPPNKGDKIRSFNQVKFLSEAGHTVHLVCLVDQKQDLAYKTELLQWCNSVHMEYRAQSWAKFLALPWLISSFPLSVPCFYSCRLQAEVDRILARDSIDVVFCFSSVMGEYLLRSKDGALHQKLLIMDFCDLDSDKWQQYRQRSRPPMSWIYRREATALLRYEQTLNRFFDLSVFVSQGEADLFKPLAPCPERIQVVQNGVDHKFFTPSLPAQFEHPKGGPGSTGQASQPPSSEAQHSSLPASQPPSLVFTGAMDYYANVDGVVWFCREILPGVQDTILGLKLYIVGANPAPEVQQLASEHVVVTGYVDDIRDYYELADICVIPLRLARGVQNKALEAMAMGIPVVTTSKVQQGIQAMPERDLLLADTPQEFSRQVRRLLTDQDLAHELGQRGRKFVLQNFDWRTNLKKLQELLSSNPEWERPKQPRSRLNPVCFWVLVLLLLVANLWPMALDSPGASITYRINPALQNFLHLPVYALFGWVLIDFLQHRAISSRVRHTFFATLGLGFCLGLELVQFFVPGRSMSVNDGLTNITGLALGWGLYAVSDWLLCRRRART